MELHCQSNESFKSTLIQSLARLSPPAMRGAPVSLRRKEASSFSCPLPVLSQSWASEPVGKLRTARQLVKVKGRHGVLSISQRFLGNELQGAEWQLGTQRVRFERFISHDYICKLVFDSLGATGLRGVEGRWKRSVLGMHGEWRKLGLGLKMCYRHFPKVKGPTVTKIQ